MEEGITAADEGAGQDAGAMTAEEGAGPDAGFRQTVLRIFPQKPVDPNSYSPLALAFLGDAVYSLLIRTVMVSEGNRQADKLHKESSALVCAAAQAEVGDAIRDLLTEEERKIWKRGRNSTPGHHAKNATAEDYLKATALETLCGWLYLRDENERMLTLIREGIARTELSAKIRTETEK
jgi:ribonuclease-3 family protein